MNRLYKYLIIILGIVLLAPLRLQAASIKIDNVTLDSKSENVTILSEPEIDGFDINLNYKFVNKEDYIKYKIVIKNKDKIDYVVKENDNDSEYVEYELDNNRIKAKGTTTIYLTIKYKKYVPQSELKNGILKESISFEILDQEGNIINPKTYDNIIIMCILLFVSIVVLSFLFIKNKKRISIFVIFVMLLPIVIYAKNALTLNTNSNIEIEILNSTFKTGSEVNNKIKSLDGHNGKEVEHFERSEEIIDKLSESNIISTSESELPIYMWYDRDSKTIYYYSENPEVFINENSSEMFKDLAKLKETNGIDALHTENIKNVESMYENCKSINCLDLNDIDLSSIETVNNMLKGTKISGLTTPNNSLPDGVVISLPKKYEDKEGNKYEKIDKNTPKGITLIMEYSAILDTGKVVNSKIKKLANSENATYETEDTNIKKFLKSNSLPNNFVRTENNIISIEKSNKEIYMWYEDNIIYYYSDAEKVYLNEDASYMFNNLTKLEDISGLNNVNSIMTTNLEGLFKNNNSIININLSKLDFSNVKNVIDMLVGTKPETIITPSKKLDDSLEIQLPKRYVDENDNLYLVIDKDTQTNITITYEDAAIFDTGKQVNAKMKLLSGDNNAAYYSSNSSIFEFVRSNSLPDNFEENDDNIISADYSNKKIYAWFKNNKLYYYTNASKIYANEDASYMFNYMTKLTDISGVENVNTKFTINMEYMFSELNSLGEINLNSFNTSSVNNFNYMFNNDLLIEELDLKHFNTTNANTMASMFKGCSNLKKLKLDNWDVRNCNYNNFLNNTITLKELSLKNWKVNTNIVNGFANYTNQPHTLEKIDVTGWDISGMTNLTDTFADFPYLSEINGLDTWNTSEITYMNDLFDGDNSLYEVNISNWDLRKTSTNMRYLLGINTVIKKLDLSNARFPQNMSYGINSINSLEEVILRNVDASITTNMSNMFSYDSNLKKIDLTGIVTSKVTNMESLFLSCEKLVTIEGLHSLDTSNVTKMAYMFNGLKSIKELDLSNFSTSKVTDASCMFLNCKKIKSLDLSSFDTINLTDTNSMFSGCDSLESVNMSNWSFKNCTYCGSAVFNSMGLSKIKSLDLENATYYGDLRYTFENLLELEELNLKNFKNINTTKLYYTFNRLEKIKHLDVSYIDTSEVTEMTGTFNGMSQLREIDLLTWDTSSLTSMLNMFSGCKSLKEIDLSSFDTSKVTNMQSTFYDNNKLEKIFVSDKFVTDKVSVSNSMFYNDNRLVGGAGTIYDSNHLDKEYAHYDGGELNPGYFSNQKYVVILNANGGDIFPQYLKYESESRIGELPKPTRSGYKFMGWYIGFEDGIKVDENYLVNKNITLFARWEDSNLRIVKFDANGGTASEVEREIYVDNKIGILPTASKENSIFLGWFTEKNGGEKIKKDTIIIDNVTYYSHWDDAKNCIYSGVLETGSELLDGQYIYRYKQEYEGSYGWINIEDDGWGVKLRDKDSNDSVTTKLCTTINDKPIVSMNSMFYESNAISIDTSSFDTSHVTHMQGMFKKAGNITSLDLSNFDTGNVVYFNEMFRECRNLYALDLSGFNTSNAKTMYNMFYEDENLVKLDLDNWDLSNLSSGYSQGGMLNKTNALESISMRNWIIPKDFSNWFSRTASQPSTVISIDVTGWNLNNTTSISGLLADSRSLVDIKGLDTWDTSHINNLIQVFYNNKNLKSLDLSTWNTSNVTSIDQMFNGCEKLESINLDNWDLSNVNLTGNSHYIFENTNSLKTISAKNWKLPNIFNNLLIARANSESDVETIDVTGWDLSNTTSISGVFKNGKNLNTIIGLNTWNTSNVTDMSFLFYDCPYLRSIDLSSFNTSNVQNMSLMFYNCSDLKTIDLSSFNTSNVSNMSYMFAGCTGLNTIYASNKFDVTNVNNSNAMFSNDTLLFGGFGTIYNSSKIDKEYAHFDEGSTNPGYLTQKTYEIIYNTNGGRKIDKKYVALGNIIGELPTPIYDELHEFEGWYLDSEFSNIVDNNYIVNSDIELFAKWNSLEHYTVAYNTSSNNEFSPKNIVPGSSVGTLPIPSKSNYYFTGWYTDNNLNIIIDSTYVPNGDITLYAGWKKSIENAQIINSTIQIQPEEEEIILLENMENVEEKYDFVSNNLSICTVDENGKVKGVGEGTTTISIIGKSSGKSISVNIVIKYIRYTITYNNNDDNGTKTSSKVIKGRKINNMPTPTYSTYEFKGWYYDGELIDENYIPEHDMILLAKWNNECENFFDDSWDVIKQNVINDMSYYSVGCRKHVTFSINDNDVDVNQSYIVRVSNNTRPSVCDGTSFSQTACGFVIEFEDVITSKIMNPYGYEPGYGAIGGWKDCQIRSYINNDIYNAFPSDLKNAIIDTVAKSGRSYSDNYNYTTTDKLYLLNTREVFEDADGNSNRGINYYDKSYNYSRQLDYYESKGVTTKNYSAAKKNSSNWWLRSAYFNNSTDFYYVSNYGINYTSSNQDYSVSPAFRIFDGINN